MKTPDRPTVNPSEPEVEKMLFKKVMKDLERGEFDGIIVDLPFAKEFLRSRGLDVDSEGFIVSSETGDYKTPYVFVDDLVEEHLREEDESIYDAFFRPVTDDRVYGWDNERLHLSDLHSIAITSDGEPHPVRDDSFDIAEFHARLNTGFGIVMGWSDIVKNNDFESKGKWLRVAKESEEKLELNCLNPKCECSKHVSNWNGERDSPKCPECGGWWDDKDITVCTICSSWYWGTYFEGESMYAEPSCANCGADMEHLENVSRYDSSKSLKAVAENNRPSYSVYGLGEQGDIVYTFSHVDTWEEAVDEKELAKSMSSGVFEEVKSVSIKERVEVDEVTRYRGDEETI